MSVSPIRPSEISLPVPKEISDLMPSGVFGKALSYLSVKDKAAVLKTCTEMKAAVLKASLNEARELFLVLPFFIERLKKKYPLVSEELRTLLIIKPKTLIATSLKTLKDTLAPLRAVLVKQLETLSLEDLDDLQEAYEGRTRHPEFINIINEAYLDNWVAAAALGEKRFAARKLIDTCLDKGSNTLDLSHLKLRSLPTPICRLTKLSHLALEDNKLTSLPPRITRLTKLQTLWLGFNELSSLPDDIFLKLIHLETVKFTKNHLTTLPPGIEKLTKLKLLFLAENELPSLPDELFDLPKNTVVDVTHNSLPLAYIAEAKTRLTARAVASQPTPTIILRRGGP